nr:MAG TPA: hypothetical protein [Caudoviricetes sp.]
MAGNFPATFYFKLRNERKRKTRINSHFPRARTCEKRQKIWVAAGYQRITPCSAWCSSLVFDE